MFIVPMKSRFRGYAPIMKVLLVVGLAFATLSACARGPEDRIQRMYSWARRPSERNEGRIEASLEDGDRDVRAAALVVMDALDKARAKRMAFSALKDPDGLVRAAAVSIVGAGADHETATLLAALAVDDPVPVVRSRALETLVPSDDPAVREAFARALDDRNRRVRRAALRAGVADPGLLPIDRLSDLVVSDPDWENRVDAAHALGASRDPGAAAGLDAARNDPNEFVRMTAAAELRALASAGAPR